MNTIDAGDAKIDGREITVEDKNLLRGVRAGGSIKIHGGDGDVEYKVVSKHGSTVTVDVDPQERGQVESTVDGVDSKTDADDGETVAGGSLHSARRFFHQAGFYLRKACSPVVFFFQRARRGYSDSDLYDAGGYQLKMLSDVLERYAWSHRGCPSDYDDASNWLVKREHGPYASKAEEFDAECRAWNEDLTKASHVIRDYMDANADFQKNIDVYGIDDASKHYRYMENEFMKVWTWLGKHILYLEY